MVESIIGPISEILFSVIIIIIHRLVEVHIFPFGNIEVLKFVVLLPYPYLMQFMIIHPLIDSAYIKRYRLLAACNCTLSSMIL